jgi:methyl-accepting chemotaxis protein
MKIATRLRLSFGAVLAIVALGGLLGAWLMSRSAAALSRELRASFQVTAVTEQLAALAHEHNVIVSMHAAAGTQPDPGRLEKVEADTEAALKRLEALDPASAARSRELITTAVRKAKLLLMAAAEEPELELEPEPKGELDDAAAPAPPPPPPRAGKGKPGKPGKATPAPPPPPSVARPAARGALPAAAHAAAPGAEGRIATLYAEAEDYLAAQHAARRQSMDEQIDRRSRDERNRFIGLFLALVLIGVAVSVLAFGAVRARVLRPLQSLSDLARRASAERDLRVNVEIAGDAEIQDLARAFAELMESLRRITLEMRAATLRLLDSAKELTRATRTQHESIHRQAAALEEARRTAGLLRESSRTVSTQVGGVLEVAARADTLSRDGAGAVSAGLEGVYQVRRQTEQVAGGFGALVTAVEQIGAITAMVKDLADQSNLLALNASLEATRAGAAGAGFHVVAREIRTLADRSIGATKQVREVLSKLLHRVRESTSLVESAQSGLEAGAGSTKLLGDSLQGLSAIVQENLGAAHRISGAVADQGAGIDQITSAVEDLARMMDETMQSVNVTGQAASVLHDVSGQVSDAVEVFKV